MEGYYTQPSARVKQINHRIQRFLKYLKFSVTLYSQCLIGLLGRMSVHALLGRDGCLDYLVQFKGSVYLILLPCKHYMLGNILRKLLLSIGLNYSEKLLLRIIIDNILGRESLSPVHPHIKRTVESVRKPSLCFIKLIRRNSKVKQNAVH